MRVLEVMESTIGGTRRHLVDLAGGLAAVGDEVHLVVSAEREPRFREDLARLTAAGVTVHELPMVRSIRPWTDWRHVRALKTLLRELRPDVVHTHSSKAGVLGRRAAAATGIGARVHTPHTFAFLFDAMFSATKRRLFRAIEAHLARRTDRLIAVSSGEAETMSALPAGGGPPVVPAERVRVVVNGVEPSTWAGAQPYEGAERAALGLEPGDRAILVAGLLNPAKGQDLAIEALARGPLAGTAGDVRLLLAGHGDDLPELEASVQRLGLSDRVSFLGWRDDLPRLMATADVLLLPSRWEGMPYAVLEAMAAGLPVVATRVDGARDLVEEGVTGRLVEVGDVDGIASALGAVLALAPEERRAMGARGAARVAERFTVEHMVAGTREVFREAIEERA